MFVNQVVSPIKLGLPVIVFLLLGNYLNTYGYHQKSLSLSLSCNSNQLVHPALSLLNSSLANSSDFKDINSFKYEKDFLSSKTVMQHVIFRCFKYVL